MIDIDRIDISEGSDLAKGNNTKECMVCHYFNLGFKFQDFVCNDCHDKLWLNISDIGIITVKNVDYRCIIHNKSEAINLLKNSVLEDCRYI